jgi:hypothetical protein
METCGEVEAEFHASLISTLGREITPEKWLPVDKHWIGEWVGPKSDQDPYKKRNIS